MSVPEQYSHVPSLYWVGETRPPTFGCAVPSGAPLVMAPAEAGSASALSAAARALTRRSARRRAVLVMRTSSFRGRGVGGRQPSSPVHRAKHSVSFDGSPLGDPTAGDPGASAQPEGRVADAEPASQLLLQRRAVRRGQRGRVRAGRPDADLQRRPEV